MIRSYIYIALTVLLTVYGQIVIKWRINQLRASGSVSGDGSLGYVLGLLLDPFVLSGLAAAFIAACTWMLAVSRLDISRAYPFVALTFVLVPIAASVFLAESVSVWVLVGAAIIVTGVAVSTL